MQNLSIGEWYAQLSEHIDSSEFFDEYLSYVYIPLGGHLVELRKHLRELGFRSNMARPPERVHTRSEKFSHGCEAL